MGKGKGAAAIARGVGLSLTAYGSMQLLLALAAVRELLPESGIPAAQAAAGALSAFLGGWYAARRSGLGTLSASVLVGGSMAALLALLGLLLYNGVVWGQGSVLLLIAILAGGAAAGLAGGRRHARRRQNGAASGKTIRHFHEKRGRLSK